MRTLFSETLKDYTKKNFKFINDNGLISNENVTLQTLKTTNSEDTIYLTLVQYNINTLYDYICHYISQNYKDRNGNELYTNGLLDALQTFQPELVNHNVNFNKRLLIPLINNENLEIPPIIFVTFSIRVNPYAFHELIIWGQFSSKYQLMFRPNNRTTTTFICKNVSYNLIYYYFTNSTTNLHSLEIKVPPPLPPSNHTDETIKDILSLIQFIDDDK